LLPQDKLKFNTRVVGIDVEKKIVTYETDCNDQYAPGGYSNPEVGKSTGPPPCRNPTKLQQVTYDKLLSTLPLDEMIRHAKIGADLGSQYEAGELRLRYSSVHVVGLGLRGVSPHELKCWLYFPEDDCPFYRCTVFSHYAEGNCPDGSVQLATLRTGASASASASASGSGGEPKPGPYWSLMFEISESSEFKPVDAATIVEETIKGAVNTGMISAETEIVSTFHRRLEKGYFLLYWG